MYPILFQIWSFSFYTHGVLAVAGIISGSLVTFSLARKKNLKTEYFFDNIVFTTLLGIIGARLAFFIVYPTLFKSWSQIFFLWEGGLISYGGFLLGGLTFVLLIRKQREPILAWLDLLSIGFFLGLAIGRIGNLFAGEYMGIVTQSRWLSVIPNNNLIAVPFFEAILCLLLFTILTVVYHKFCDKLKTGVLFSLSLGFYGLGRFFIDYGRDEKNLLLGISLGQTISILIFIISLIFLAKRGRSKYESADSVY